MTEIARKAVTSGKVRLTIKVNRYENSYGRQFLSVKAQVTYGGSSLARKETRCDGPGNVAESVDAALTSLTEDMEDQVRRLKMKENETERTYNAIEEGLNGNESDVLSAAKELGELQ